LIGETQEKPRLQGSLALEVQRALVRRAEILRERKVPLNRDTFKVLLAREEQQLINRLEQRFGTRQGLQAGQEVSGTVVGYELLGDGYRMVVKLQRGFVLRKVARKEAQLAFGTEVSLCRARKGATGGRETSDFITVKAKGPGHRQGQSRNKG
jgi:hypothetical protein